MERGEQYVGVSLKIHGPAADAEAWRRGIREREREKAGVSKT